MTTPAFSTNSGTAPQSPCRLGIPRRHRQAPIVLDAMNEPLFAARWFDESDGSFRPFALAVLEIGNVSDLPSVEREAIYRAICTTKRPEMLNGLIGKRVPSRALRWMSRTAWKEFSGEDWRTLLALASEDENDVLGHVKPITATLLRQFDQIPPDLREPGLLGVASRLQVPKERWHRWQDFIMRADAQMKAEISRAAQAVRSRGDLWDLYFRCEGRHLQPFALPAQLIESELLEPIASPLDMVLEAARMNNCLGKRIGRVRSGNRIFFKMRGGALVDAEIVRQGESWVQGEVFGYANQSVAPDLERQVRDELVRLAKPLFAHDLPAKIRAEDDCTMALRQDARKVFSKDEIETFAASLRTIRGRSRSWTNGAFTIFELPDGLYVQFMSSPDGSEYLMEISSHNYVDNVDKYLRSDAIEVIEAAGFEWPNGAGNFLRWFNISSEGDILALAELTLAILASLFGCRTVQGVIVKTHVPA